MISFLAKGGILVIPILFCSVVALTIVLERLYRFRKLRIKNPDLPFKIQKALKEKGVDAALLMAEDSKNLLGRVLKEGISVCLLNSLIASAHTLWLNASDYSPKVYPKYGASTKIYFGWGHHYPVDDFLSIEDLQEFSLIYPDGKIKKITPGSGGFLATRISFKKPGLCIISAIKRRVFTQCLMMI